MKYFVFYNDDYEENGGIGLESFEYTEQAEQFIMQRMKGKNRFGNPQYTVIKGELMTIKDVKVVTEIKIE